MTKDENTKCFLETGWRHVLLYFVDKLSAVVSMWLSGLIHLKSPGSPNSANHSNFLQNYSLRKQKLLTLLCGILSQRAKALNMCQSVVNKCHKCLMNMFLVSDSLFLQFF